MDELARQPKHGPHYGQLLHILNEMQNHQSSWPFQRPVSQDEVPDYYNVITEPMDLETMEKRLEQDHYGSPEDFVRDAKLIFTNCRRYNNESTSYWKNANKLEKFMNQKLKEIPEWSVGSSGTPYFSPLFFDFFLPSLVALPRGVNVIGCSDWKGSSRRNKVWLTKWRPPIPASC